MASRLWPIWNPVTDKTTGVPLSNAKVYTYNTGTLTSKTTYSDQNLTTANPNPLVTNSAGFFENGGTRVDVWGSGDFKFVVEDSAGNQLAVFDPVEDLSTATSTPSKQAVIAATTANITLSGEQTIDGVAVVDGDRVLVKDQTSGDENGIYVVSTSSWSRADDADTANEIEASSVFVQSGTANSGKIFGVTTTGDITLDTTTITYTELADPTSEIDTEKKTSRGVSSKSDDYTLVADDAGKIIVLTGGTGKNFTVTASVFTTGEFGVFEQHGTGQITVIAGSGTTIRKNSAYNALTRGQWSSITWRKISSSEIMLGGDLSPV